MINIQNRSKKEKKKKIFRRRENKKEGKNKRKSRLFEKWYIMYKRNGKIAKKYL